MSRITKRSTKDVNMDWEKAFLNYHSSKSESTDSHDDDHSRTIGDVNTSGFNDIRGGLCK